MQSLHDLSHLEIIFQKAPSHISMVIFVASSPVGCPCLDQLGQSRNYMNVGSREPEMCHSY